MPYASPILAHCQMLREHFGPSIGIVFFSPCIAKKGEADANPDLLDVALTFEDLRRWLMEEQISFETGMAIRKALFRTRPGRAHYTP